MVVFPIPPFITCPVLFGNGTDVGGGGAEDIY
jgi:hypothetical protein